MVMTDDERLSDLFAQGTAPESDPVFTLSVTAEIGRARRRGRLAAFAVRAGVVSALAGAAFVAAGLSRALLAQLVDEAPQVMGAPAPMVLGVTIVGLALLAWRQVLSPRAGAG